MHILRYIRQVDCYVTQEVELDRIFRCVHRQGPRVCSYTGYKLGHRIHIVTMDDMRGMNALNDLRFGWTGCEAEKISILYFERKRHTQ
jgi:hypothetical protein